MSTTELEHEVNQWILNHPRAADESEVAYMARAIFEYRQIDYLRGYEAGFDDGISEECDC